MALLSNDALHQLLGIAQLSISGGVGEISPGFLLTILGVG